MSKGRSYGQEWDKQYFIDFFLHKTGNLWDVSPEYSVGEDLPQFRDSINSRLPMLDVGCGTGKEAHYLSQYVQGQVIGIDVAKRAIQLAQESFPQEESGIEWLVLDILDKEAVKELHDQWGDMNIYMRGVLHQIKIDDRKAFVESLLTMMGAQGSLFLNEVAKGLEEHLTQKEEFDELPERMQQVFTSHLPPEGLSIEEIENLFGHMKKISNVKQTYLQTSLSYQDGSAIKIPSISCLIS